MSGPFSFFIPVLWRAAWLIQESLTASVCTGKCREDVALLSQPQDHTEIHFTLKGKDMVTHCRVFTWLIWEHCFN